MKVRSRKLNIVASYVATFFLKLLFLTVRVCHYRTAEDGTPYERPSKSQRFTFSMWHDQIVLAVFSLRTWSLAGLISQHRDGSYLADSVLIAGIQPVRGSTSRGGAEAVSEILSRPDLHLAITPDGPRGPRRVMKEGIVYISSRSRRPIVRSSPWSVIATVVFDPRELVRHGNSQTVFQGNSDRWHADRRSSGTAVR